jgi:hypothetical protein
LCVLKGIRGDLIYPPNLSDEKNEALNDKMSSLVYVVLSGKQEKVFP